MTLYQSDQPGPCYQNPVYPKSFPDPFVLKYDGEYFAYCTGRWDDGRVFGVLRSKDLVHWTPVGGAMTELANPEPFYWAPEVTYWNGTFYLYYSAGNETFMQLRVATSDRPDGGFEDAGIRLTKEDFAIDAHVFLDDDGQRYLFYATDFLDHSHIGTGIVVDRLVDWFTLAGEPRPVVRAKYDWQVYDPARKEKGGVRWHTVEGPFVLKRKGRYFMMFSGGNWQQPTYGVSFALSGDLSSPNEWLQFSDGRKVMPILRTDEKHQVGPGHNSVIRGPNNRERYCIYHYWHEGNRVLAVNRMDFAGPRIFIESRPYLPKPVPLPVSRRFTLNDAVWTSAGKWEFGENSAKSSADRFPAAIRSERLPTSFLCEFSFRASEVANNGRFGFRFEGEPDVLGGLFFCLNDGAVFYEWIEGESETSSGPMILGSGFRFDVLHRITIAADHLNYQVKLDDTYLSIERYFPKNPEHLSLFAEGAEVTFMGFTMTEGFEECFDSENLRGWSFGKGKADLKVVDQEMIFTNLIDEEAIIFKGEPEKNFEFVANIRLKGPADPDYSYGFVLLDEDNNVAERFEFRERGGRFSLSNGNESSGVDLPFDFNYRVFYQFRFRKQANRLYFDIETVPLGSREVTEGKARIGIFGRNVAVALEMVRLTVIDN